MLTSIKKATTIVEAFMGGQREWSVAKLSEKLGMPQPTVHHFLSSFREAGWIVQDPATRHYRLGVKMWEIGCAAVNFREIAETARPYLRTLVNACGETVHLGMVSIEDPGSVVYLDRIDSSQPVLFVTVIGSKAPSHSSAMGKAIVAHNPEYEQAVLHRPLEAVTARTIIDPEGLRKDFEATRRRGYSISKGEFAGEMIGIAAPVRDRFGVVTLGIGIWGPGVRMTPDYIDRVSPQLIETANQISIQLGNPERR